MAQPTDPKPPEPSILGGRFKCIDYVQDKWIAIWDMGNILSKTQKPPEVWTGFEYWDEESRQSADKRLRFICGMLNGIRQPSEVIDF
jgi:hypothetical protein